MSQTLSNAASFSQILREIKARHAWVKDVYYSEHIGNWTLQSEDGESMELTSFDQVRDEIRIKRYGRIVKEINSKNHLQNG